MIEVNTSAIEDRPPLQIGSQRVMVTPPITESFWLWRVRLTDRQAVVAFPKFGTIGIGFQHEFDWNCNLPYTCTASEIADHIWHNRSDGSITMDMVVQAIEELQETIAEARQ